VSGENASSCFDPHHRRAGAGVLDWRFTLKASLSPVIDVALTRDVVGRNAIVWQAMIASFQPRRLSSPA
jgi:hypothetical protein